MGIVMKSKRVAVIGAGMAGISAANALVRSGWEVVVFEKSRGWGAAAAQPNGSMAAPWTTVRSISP